MSLLDIIIVNYNSTDFLVKCLESIYSSLEDLTANVIVQDNNSADDVDRIKAHFSNVILKKNSYNMGFSAAVNKALSKSYARYVVLVNPDSYVEKDFFKLMLRYMDNNPDVGSVGPKVLDHDGTIQGSARAFPNVLTPLFGRSSLLSRISPNNRITRANIVTSRSDGKNPIEVDWVSGACMVVRRKAINDVGLMDEGFFMYWEDADWCMRMWQKGWKVVYFPQATVVHYVGGSSNKKPVQSIFEFHKSSYRLFNKYCDPAGRFLNPLVLSALASRFMLMLFINKIFAGFKRLQSPTIPGKTSAIAKKTEKIKLLRIISRLNIGGPSIHAHLLTNGLDKEKFESILAMGDISPQEGNMGYLFDSLDDVIRISELQREISIRMDIKAIMKIYKILRKENPDILHTHTAKAGFSARLAVMFYNFVNDRRIRTVHTFHGNIFKDYFSKGQSFLFVLIERMIARLTDVIIAISKTQRKELVEEFRIAPAWKIRKIELGFNLQPFFSSRSLKGKFKQNIGIDDETILIGIIGRLVPIKNHMMFLKAAKKFCEQNPVTRVKFVIIGDGELRDKLEIYCKKMGLNNHVIFCGWAKNVPLVYSDLDILALTSLNEGTPVSIIEAMAASVPVIATDVGGVADLVGKPKILQYDGFRECERGILCRKNDAFEFAKGLKYLMELDAYEKKRITDSARSFVEKKFDRKRLIQDVESLYFELTARDA